MKRQLTILGSIGILVLAAFVGAFQTWAIPIQSPTTWRDNFDDDTGLYSLVDTAVVAATGHLALARSTINPDQYVTSGLAASVIINPLVAAVPAPVRLAVMAPGPGDFVYFIEGQELGGFVDNKFLSYQLSSGQFNEIHTFVEKAGQLDMSLVMGTDGLIYIGINNYLYAYNPNNGNLDNLATLGASSLIHKLAAAPSGLIYGIAGLRLFSYNPTTATLSDLGIINSTIDWGRTALTVADDGKVYGGYAANSVGRLFAYDPGTGWITDKGQVLGQQSVNTLDAGQDGLIYGGTNTYDGAMGRFFAYDPASGHVADLAGSYGGVYAVVSGQDGLIYGAARRNGYNAYLFIYNPASGTLTETGRIKAGGGHVSALAWASDGRVYGVQTDGAYNLVVYDPAISAFSAWDKVTFSYTAPAGTAVRVDVLDAQGNTLLVNVKSGDSLSSINPVIHPAIQLCANLSGNGSTTPLIDNWAVRVVVPWPLYTISGRVADANNDPIAGVTVSAGAGYTAVTDSNGNYTLSDLQVGTYSLTPTISGYTFQPATRVVTLPPDAAGQNFVILASPVSITLPMSGTTNLPASLIYTDTQGLPTTIEFPADAVTQTTTIESSTAVAAQAMTLVLTPTLVTGGAGLAFAGHAFNLAVYRNGNLQPDLTFTKPATVTIHYSAADIGVVSDEGQLALWWWTGSEWENVTDTCTPPSVYNRDLANGMLSVPTCHLSLFSLLGPTYQTYLPLVLRSH